MMHRRFAEAEVEYPKLVELNPAAPWAHAGSGLCYLLEGRFEEAVKEARQDSAVWAQLLVQSLARFGQKQMPESNVALSTQIRDFADVSAYQIAEVYAYRGDPGNTFNWLERAYRQRDGGLTSIRVDPLFAPVNSDPRWGAFMKKLGLDGALPQ
jgi:tetratricopeptide (TPR) repeat protein